MNAEPVMDQAERFARDGFITVLAGWVTAFVIGGIGTRVIMRVLAETNSQNLGVETDAGAISGGITVLGTARLLVFVAVIAGTLGGIAYAFARRWLPTAPVWRGLTFGVLVFCFFGRLLFDPDNADFALFGPPELAIFLFGVLFPIYGFVLPFVAERFLSPVPAVLMNPWVTAAGYTTLVGFAAFGLFRTVVAISAMT